MLVLGISGYYHDSAAALVRDGEIVAAAQEERFSRRKADAGFPSNAAAYCLDEARVSLDEIDYVAFYDKPILTFDRLLETYLSFAPAGMTSFVKAMPVWIKEKLFLPGALKSELKKLDRGSVPPILFGFHHNSHAASAFYPSPFECAAILVVDGVGEWSTCSLGVGNRSKIELQNEIRFPHSIGLLYAAFTYYLGFKVNDGEYKVMGLAPYGEPKYVQTILDHLIDIKPDGSFRLDMRYFNYCTGLTMTNDRFHDLFGAPPRKPTEPLSRRDMDLARSIQAVTEEVILRLARTLRRNSELPNLCLAGGVALNCVANGRIVREGIFEQVWIQPAAGDAGGAIGAALAVAYDVGGIHRRVNGDSDGMSGSYLGPAFGVSEIRAELDRNNACFRELDEDAMLGIVVNALTDEKVVGWFQGRMEFGPRALGNRSILGDPRSSRMQRLLNMKVKYRESFRPFAPAVLRENVSEYFELDGDSPYMMVVADVQKNRRRRLNAQERALHGIALLNVPRSDIPAVTHVDYSARIQTVHRETNPRFHRLLTRFRETTGFGLLVNTSFNVRDEPIVCTPGDAYRCFMSCDMDILVMDRFVLRKDEQ
jgi:carbamoyltransferase